MPEHPWFPITYTEHRPFDRYGTLTHTLVGRWQLGDQPPIGTATVLPADPDQAARHTARWREQAYVEVLRRTPQRREGV